jgi:hypothetical protein
MSSPIGLAVLTFIVMNISAVAQDAIKAPLPDLTPCASVISEVATCYGGKHASGAYLTAAMPKDWNGHLVVFAHGGPSVVPPTATYSQADLAKYSIAVKLGYAWVASTYRREGYGVQMAAEDTEDARRFFIDNVARPKRTIFHGASWGGLVGAKLLETYARTSDGSVNYDGALFNSGFLAGSVLGYEFRADLRVVYQYYCKNLPRPEEPEYLLLGGIPADSKLTMKALETTIDECTGVLRPASARSELQKENLANILKVMRFPELFLVRHMQAATFLFREITQRTTGGRSAFSNSAVRYLGSSDDEALNRGVARFTADPEAVAALKLDGEPTGTLRVPVLSIHSINDPQVAVEVQSVYREKIDSAENSDRLVQAYTDEKAHTAQSAPELAAALDSVLQWIETGVKPTAVTIADTCKSMQKRFDGRCSYDPEFKPASYSTRYARGAIAEAAAR